MKSAVSVTGCSRRDLILDEVLELSLHLLGARDIGRPALFRLVEYDVAVEDDLENPAAAAADRDVDIAPAGRKKFG